MTIAMTIAMTIGKTIGMTIAMTMGSTVEKILLVSQKVGRAVLMRVQAFGTVMRPTVERADLGTRPSLITCGPSGVMDYDTTKQDRWKSYTISITDYKESFLCTTDDNPTATKVIVIKGTATILVTFLIPLTYPSANRTET